MDIDIIEIQAIQRRIDEINRTPLEQLRITIKGNPHELTHEEISEWRYTGLSNFHIISRILFADTIQVR